METVAPINLTPRQWQFLALLAEGYTNADISLRMAIRPKTAENYALEIYSILFGDDRTLNPRVAAAAWYLANKKIRRYVIEATDLPVLIEVRKRPGGNFAAVSPTEVRRSALAPGG